MGPTVTIRQDHPPTTSEMPAVSQKAIKTERLGCGTSTLKSENSLPLPHPQANWGLLGRGREERAQSHTLPITKRQYKASSLQVEPSPTLAFSGSQSPHSPVRRTLSYLGFVVQLSSLSCGELCSSHTSHPTPAAQTVSLGPKSQGLARFKACLPLPCRNLKQPPCVLKGSRSSGALGTSITSSPQG